LVGFSFYCPVDDIVINNDAQGIDLFAGFGGLGTWTVDKTLEALH
jgi:hypothetical protein